MKCQLMDIAPGPDGHESIVSLSVPGDWSEEYAELCDGPVSVEIKKWRRSRSKDANRYLWELIDQLAAKLNRSKIEVYREAIRDIGGVSYSYLVRDRAVQPLIEGWSHNGVGWFAEHEPSKLMPGFENVVLYMGSSVYDSKQMSSLIDHVVQDCKAVGIVTLPPHEIEAMEMAWGGRNGSQ